LSTTDSRPEVLLLTVDAGGGHRAAANALVAAAEEKHPPFRFRVASIQDVLAPEDVFRRVTGHSIEDTYNLLLRRRGTLLMGPLLRLLHAAIRVRHRPLTRSFARFLERAPPAAVLSVVPNFNGVIRDAARLACPGRPVVVLLTDFADYPPHFWIEPGLDHVIVATGRAHDQARAAGLPEASILRVSGMVLHPTFHAAVGRDVGEAVRRELGIAPETFVALLLYGGHGAAEMAPLARALRAEDPALHVIALCGRNHRLLAEVREDAARGGRLTALDFTSRVAEFMAASDLLVSKPGPGTLAEAFAQKLPVVVTKNRHTIPQERFNADFVAEHGLGRVVSDWREIAGLVAGIRRRPEQLAEFRRAAQALPPNRAVYEVVEFLGRLTRPA
jgi:1,2-diacylglycerol 3-beta-galactosyltransferase